ncbi:MAG TPA: hypothetical protein VG944_17815 [Fimbriimonas sp.]|nr:hypothetical protein [Fimbriimonas sp.]
MPQVFRSSDVVEIHSEKAISYAVGAVFAISVAALLYYYRGSTGMFVPLATIILVIGLGCLGYAAYCALQIRKVKYVFIDCPYCDGGNALTDAPDEDFLCVECHRLIPIVDGKVLPVEQVRCGYCNALNFYSEKTDVLLCESCNHEIPIAHDEGHIQKKHLAIGFAVEEDDRPYELVLLAHGHKTEDLIQALQQMLALNRNQVKDMLANLPVTLLTGIPKRKAEMLKAQLSIHDAAADCRPLSETVS